MTVHEAAKVALTVADRFWRNFVDVSFGEGESPRVFPSIELWKAHYSHLRPNKGQATVSTTAHNYFRRIAKLAVAREKAGFPVDRNAARRGGKLWTPAEREPYNVRVDRVMHELSGVHARDNTGSYINYGQGPDGTVIRRPIKNRDKATSELIRVLVEHGFRTKEHVQKYVLFMENLTLAYTTAPATWPELFEGDALRINAAENARKPNLPDFAVVGLLNAIVESGEIDRTGEPGCQIHKMEFYHLRFVLKSILRACDWFMACGETGKPKAGPFMLEDPAKNDEFDSFVAAATVLRNWGQFCIEWCNWDFERGKEEAAKRLQDSSLNGLVTDASEIALTRRALNLDAHREEGSVPDEQTLIALREQQMDGFWVGKLTGTVYEVWRPMVGHAYAPFGADAPDGWDEAANGPYESINALLLRVYRGGQTFKEPDGVLVYVYADEFAKDFLPFKGDINALSEIPVEDEEEAEEPTPEPEADAQQDAPAEQEPPLAQAAADAESALQDA